MNNHITSDNFDSIWRQLLFICKNHPDHIVESRGGAMYELENISFTLTNPKNNLVDSEARNFNMDFAQKFFNWIMAGKTDPSELFSTNSNAKNYADKTKDENNGRNTAYGPRILKQLGWICDELSENPGSRRAVISILEGDDNEMLERSRNGETKMEYPCTESCNFRIRDNKLDLVVSMRSNCACKTVCYDAYNFTNLQFVVLNILKEKGLDIELGSYTVKATSYHFFEKDLPLVDAILSEK